MTGLGDSCRSGGQADFPGRSHEPREYVQSQQGCSQRDCLGLGEHSGGAGRAAGSVLGLGRAPWGEPGLH